MNLKEHLLLLENAFEKSDIAELKKLSAVFAGEAFSHYQKENIQLSIAAYACAKFLEKPYVIGSSEWSDFRKNLLFLLKKAIEDLDGGKEKQALERLSKSISLIEGLGEDLGRFAITIIEKARQKAGAEIYARGGSLGTASELSGADKRELASYISSTKMPEKYVTKSVGQRLQEVKRILS